MVKNGDLPAMPVKGNCVDASGAYCGDVVYSAGLTKREQIAMAAMQGLLAGVHGDSALYDDEHDWVKNVSEASVEYADALLAELEKSK